MMKPLSRLAIWGFLLGSLPLFAQFDSAEVLGTVRDKTTGAVPRASVVLTSQETGSESKTTTDEAGNFTFSNVKIGVYTVVAEASGFARGVAKDISVNVNARQRVDLTLQVGTVSETVEVTDAAAQLQTDSSDRGQLIHKEQVVELPLNGRTYSDLALLSPGVLRTPLAYSGTPREGAFSINGLRSTYNNFLLDGIDNNAYGTSNQGFANQVAQPSPDSVAEFKVITNNYSAEYGRSGGGTIDVAMRSGTNQFHGTGYEFLRNTELNAVGYIFGARPATFKKPILQQNQFGATIGGPIVKNKVFFFGDYEGFRHIDKSLNFSSLPTLNDRQGILPVPVTNPITGAVYPANTPIPVTAISSFARQVFADLPAPNSGAAGARSNNYQQLSPNRNYTDKYDAKLDGQIRNNMNGFLRFSQRKMNVFTQPDIPGPSGGNSNGYTRALNQQAGAGYTWAINPTTFFEARVGVSRTRAGKFPPLIGGPSMLALYGITGLPTDPQLTGGLTNQTITGLSALGRQSTNPQFQNPLSFDYKFNLSHIMGRHALKAGYEFVAIRTQVNDINPLYGRDAYAGGFSRPAGGPADATSYSIADFLFGLRSQYALANYVVGNYRQHENFLYVQDDFRFSPTLTFNMGLRWEYATPRWERDNVLSNFDPATNTILKAKDGSIYDRSLVNPDRKNFAPRLGFAWSGISKTVVRGGYGISYVHQNRVGSADLLGINGPQVVIATVNQSNPLDPAFRTTQQGYPIGLTDPKNFNPILSNITYIPKDLVSPMIQSYFFSVQRELVRNLVLDVGYVGNYGQNIPIIGDYNQANPQASAAGTASLQSRRPDQAFGAITWFDPAGFSDYNALQVKVEKRTSGGLTFLNSFTWGKAIDNGAQSLDTAGGNAASPQDIHNLDAEKGVSGYDQKFTDILSVVYQLPFGRGKKFGGNIAKPLDYAIGGWELTGINTALSAFPITLRAWSGSVPTNFQTVGNLSDFRGGESFRPNVLGDVLSSGVADITNQYFNTANVALSTDASHPFGNAGRNSTRATPLNTLDLGIFKNFQLPRESMKLQFRSEFFNVFNHTNFQPANSDRASAAFGTIRSTFPARQIQFALKLYF
jgi:Carboxypeptidase regulatory-like domain/TonB-dependent Receptor Plug Domain